MLAPKRLLRMMGPTFYSKYSSENNPAASAPIPLFNKMQSLHLFYQHYKNQQAASRRGCVIVYIILSACVAETRI